MCNSRACIIGLTRIGVVVVSLIRFVPLFAFLESNG